MSTGDFRVASVEPKTGRELYEIWSEYHAARNCEVDRWDDLDSLDQAAWNYTAEQAAK